MSYADINAKRAALIQQCPILPPLSESEAAKLLVHVERCGATGPRVVIIHGGVQGNVGGGPATFAKQKSLGDRGWMVEVVDRPGFGQSPSRGVDDMEADAVWIAEMLGNGAHLIGHSFGGAEALLAAARRPQAVLSLTLVEPALQALESVGQGSNGDHKTSMNVQMGEMLLSSTTPADYIRRFMEFLGAAEKFGTMGEDMATRFGCAMLRAKMAEPQTLQMAAATIANASIPVLAISGGWNEAVDSVTRTAARLTGGRYAKVASTNHFPHLDNPQEFNRVLEAFMSEH